MMHDETDIYLILGYVCVWVYILYQLIYPHISPMLAGSVQGFAGRQWPEDACIFIWECGGVARGWRVRWWKFSESKLWFDQTCSTSIPPLQRRTHNPHSQVDHGRCGWVLGGQSSLGMYTYEKWMCFNWCMHAFFCNIFLLLFHTCFYIPCEKPAPKGEYVRYKVQGWCLEY